MAIQAYLYNSCSSCRKTDEILKESDVDYERREFFKDRFTKEELRTLLEQNNLTVQDVISTRSTPYKQHALANRDLTDDEILDLMIEDPRLLRRPIVISGDTVIIGHNEKQLRELVANQ
ncbi:MAG TPA: Spx/MgsR family RNA polymerase-binding regulatory protein [Thermomicrobiales bacterium]|nr:Spx/MgsR family RNA polymerase-binding regulatory protein [Thermomicrobiales bacterium]